MGFPSCFSCCFQAPLESCGHITWIYIINDLFLFPVCTQKQSRKKCSIYYITILTHYNSNLFLVMKFCFLLETFIFLQEEKAHIADLDWRPVDTCWCDHSTADMGTTAVPPTPNPHGSKDLRNRPNFSFSYHHRPRISHGKISKQT